MFLNNCDLWYRAGLKKTADIFDKDHKYLVYWLMLRNEKNIRDRTFLN